MISHIAYRPDPHQSPPASAHLFSFRILNLLLHHMTLLVLYRQMLGDIIVIVLFATICLVWRVSGGGERVAECLSAPSAPGFLLCLKHHGRSYTAVMSLISLRRYRYRLCPDGCIRSGRQS